MRFQAICSTGSPLKPNSYDYVYRDIKTDLLLASISGGTDIIACFMGENSTLPVHRGEIQSPHLVSWPLKIRGMKLPFLGLHKVHKKNWHSIIENEINPVPMFLG